MSGKHRGKGREKRGGVLRSLAQWSRASLASLSKTSGETNGEARISGSWGDTLRLAGISWGCESDGAGNRGTRRGGAGDHLLGYQDGLGLWQARSAALRSVGHFVLACWALG